MKASLSWRVGAGLGLIGGVATTCTLTVWGVSALWGYSESQGVRTQNNSYEWGLAVRGLTAPAALYWLGKLYDEYHSNTVRELIEVSLKNNSENDSWWNCPKAFITGLHRGLQNCSAVAPYLFSTEVKTRTQPLLPLNVTATNDTDATETSSLVR